MMLEELSQRDEMLSIISDMHKDAYGTRPRGIYNNMTDAELQREMEVLQVAVDRAIKEDEERKEFMISRFKARVAEMFDLGAADEATAIRWIMQAEEAEDFDQLEWRLGIPFGYFAK